MDSRCGFEMRPAGATTAPTGENPPSVSGGGYFFAFS
jgi:hypothetical protein